MKFRLFKKNTDQLSKSKDKCNLMFNYLIKIGYDNFKTNMMIKITKNHNIYYMVSK